MQNRPKGQHTVPQVYLRHFATTKEKINVLDLRRNKTTTKGVNRTSVQNNFYNVILKDSENKYVDPYSFERWMAKDIEGPIKAVFETIISKQWPLDRSDREFLAYFISIQYTRGKHYRDATDDLISLSLLLQLALEGKDTLRSKGIYGRHLSENEVDIIWEQVKTGTLQVSQDKTQHNLEYTKDAEKFYPSVYNKKWCLFNFETLNLLTCDSPVVALKPPAPREGVTVARVGLSGDFPIYMPLTRKMGLLMLDRSGYGPSDAFIDGESSLWEGFHPEFNKEIINNSQNEIYYHPDDVSLIPSCLPAPKERIRYHGSMQTIIDVGEKMGGIIPHDFISQIIKGKIILN